MTDTWHLYRTKQGEWVAYSGPLNFTNSDRRWIEKKLAKCGVRPAEIEKLFQDAAEKSEGIITVPIGLERLDELFHPPAVTGCRGAYRWLTTGQHELDNLRRQCPQALIGKYVAVTSLDSGPMVLTDEEKHSGWNSRNEIAYSPRVQSAEDCRIERLPGGECVAFNEWYVFNSPCDLGELWHGNNVFEAPITPGRVLTFVNFADGFALHNPEMTNLVSLFWEQLDWIQPESYIADADVLLTFVSRNEEIFFTVSNALSDIALKSR
jgi:hypothetical protein